MKVGDGKNDQRQMDEYPLHRTGTTRYNGTGKGTQYVGCGVFSLPRSKGKEGEGEMANLWEETNKVLKAKSKSFNDVVAICGNDFQITKEDFKKYSKTEYDDGYGSPQVAEDLLVIGDDFWLERHEYDGSEWWEFKQMPKYKELPFNPITALTVEQAHANGVDCSCGWENLADLQCTPQNDEVRE